MQGCFLVLVLLVKLQLSQDFISCSVECHDDERDILYSCKDHQFCCNGYCCDELYAVWYIWVLFFGLILLCCVAAVIIRKKKARKNRVTHSMFLERIRERIERQMLEESNVSSVNNTSGNFLDEPHMMFNSSNQSVGIGGMGRTDGMITPVGRSPANLFLARAPPPYRSTLELDNPHGSRDEAPPSYDSIFANENSQNNNQIASSNGNNNNQTNEN
ncbi:uncharacterized protein [Clytia hemisphaerica]|uniref:Uncharacterized protein n=1 Tax=Clytia hemisphaerica TaxID=252671 RepID=A0A7M6DR24_9CNID|eukprot:TCONS_00069703-protein